MLFQPGDGLEREWESLHRLGLRFEWINEALGASNTERRLCVRKHSSKSAPGYYAYNGLLTSLSQQSCASGQWERADPMSMPLLINTERSIALAVTSGDSITGQYVYGREPKSRNTKGKLTKELILINRSHDYEEQLDLFGELPQKKPSQIILEELQDFYFWHLLVYFDKEMKEIRSEVSQPRGPNSEGRIRINEWYPRIILTPYKLDSDDFNVDEDPNDGFGDDDPIVTRR